MLWHLNTVMLIVILSPNLVEVQVAQNSSNDDVEQLHTIIQPQNVSQSNGYGDLSPISLSLTSTGNRLQSNERKKMIMTCGIS